jgi:hypothetical protein
MCEPYTNTEMSEFLFNIRDKIQQGNAERAEDMLATLALVIRDPERG